MTIRFARLTSRLLSAATLAALVACTATPTRESPGEYLDDSILTARVKSALIADRAVPARQINVESFKGRVQLSGFVDSQAAIDKATAIARSVPGVASVANDMRLRQP